jgi:hypothetical protein
MKKSAICFLLFSLIVCTANAQWFYGVKFMGITFHSGKNENGGLYDIAIGKKNRLALNFGVALTVEYMFYPTISVKYDQALFRDCAGKFAGASMFNIRYTALLGNAGNASVGLGPFFYYRRNWKEIDGYIDEGYFKFSKNNRWQTKFVWYGGEFEYNYPMDTRTDFSINFFPGYPVVYAITPGIRIKGGN